MPPPWLEDWATSRDVPEEVDDQCWTYGLLARLDSRLDMATATLEKYSIAAVLDSPVVDGSNDMIVRGIKVFRVGRFKNSVGNWNDWSAERLQRAAENFNRLRVTRVFPDVPVRLDHTKSVRDLVGYFHELRFDGQYLVADILFTKRSAYDEYNAGHLRNVSLEIGQYETNDEVLYDDVVQGLAFVDIPAVEGLHQRPTGEEHMGTQNKGDEEQETEATPEPEPTPTPAPAEPPEEPEPPAQVPSAQETRSREPDEHRRPVQTFRINGAEVADLAAVQTHIDVLERFRADTNTSLRNSFVDDLVKHGVIMAPKAEAMKIHVATLSNEQFAAFPRDVRGRAGPQPVRQARHDDQSRDSSSAGRSG